jgi:anti-sigma regulatory factor (Ser/Thr protein kinase)
MHIESFILEIAERKGKVATMKLVKKTGFSHAYVHRILQRLVEGGHLYKTGSTKNARYVPATPDSIDKAKAGINYYSRVFKSIAGLNANKILEELKKKFAFIGIPENVVEIFDYAFTELLSNAIGHSQTEKLNIKVEKKENVLSFEIRDFGIGIFKSIKEKLKLATEEDAALELIKGSGKGMYFASKLPDTLIIQSGVKKIIFNNLIDDIFIRTIKDFAGTKILFNINIDSSRLLSDVLNKAPDNYGMIDSGARVFVKLFSMGNKYVSRFEARKALDGMGKFQTVILDFKGIESIGQGFVDEVFMVWKRNYPDTKITIENANDDVMFMIKRAVG